MAVNGLSGRGTKSEATGLTTTMPTLFDCRAPIKDTFAETVTIAAGATVTGATCNTAACTWVTPIMEVVSGPTPTATLQGSFDPPSPEWHSIHSYTASPTTSTTSTAPASYEILELAVRHVYVSTSTVSPSVVTTKSVLAVV